jgi:hypothetical protein
MVTGDKTILDYIKNNLQLILKALDIKCDHVLGKFEASDYIALFQQIAKIKS